MLTCLNRFGLITATVFTIGILTSLCGCTRMTGLVMNESGQRYYERGNYAMARLEFHKAVIEDPGNPHYHYNLAAACQKLGEFHQAEQYYHHAMNLDPGHQPSYHGLASMMIDQGRSSEAEQLITTWAGAQPYSAEAQVEMAWLQRHNGDVSGAEQSLRQALQINPQNEFAMSQLGQIYEDQGRPAEAIAMYDRSLFVDPYQHRVRSRVTNLQQMHPELEQHYTHQQPTQMAEWPMMHHYGAPPPQMAYGNPWMHGDGLSQQQAYVPEQFADQSWAPQWDSTNPQLAYEHTTFPEQSQPVYQQPHLAHMPQEFTTTPWMPSTPESAINQQPSPEFDPHWNATIPHQAMMPMLPQQQYPGHGPVGTAPQVSQALPEVPAF